ncbi:carboxylesterase family protein [Streptomyces sp. NPDC057963]|uniref:carboxylesterase family protein n=1 Tax=Streptomyces sp. NPDC057963 TaxID=3346290 RepID=UPI0036E821FE
MAHAKSVSKWPFAALSLVLSLVLGLGPGWGPVQAAASAQPGQNSGTVVSTTNGKVRGGTHNRVRSFQSIPYAAPSVGERRWRGPEPAAAWTGVRKATTPGAACTQPQGLPVGQSGGYSVCDHLASPLSAGLFDRADAALGRYPLSGFASAGEALATVRTDVTWSVPTLDTARLLSTWTPTRMYEFSERDTPWFKGYPAPSFGQRAQRMAELPYLFDLALFENVQDEQSRFRDRMLHTCVAFAASGRTSWPAFRGEHGYTQTLSSRAWKRADFATDHHYAFWKNLR